MTQRAFQVKLFQLREAKGWNLKTAAEKIGIAQGDLSRMEGCASYKVGKSVLPMGPTLRTLYNISKAYGVTMDALAAEFMKPKDGRFE